MLPDRLNNGIFIPKELLDIENLSWTEKGLLIEIHSRTNSDYDIPICSEDIAELLGITPRHAMRLINSLIEKDYLIHTDYDGKKRKVKTAIRLSLKATDEDKATKMSPTKMSPTKMSPTKMSGCDSTNNINYTNNINDIDNIDNINSKEYINTNIKCREDINTNIKCREDIENISSRNNNNIDYSLFNCSNIKKKKNLVEKEKESFLRQYPYVEDDWYAPFSEWLAYKRERKNTYTKRGVAAAYTRLKNLSENNPVVGMEIVQQSIANNYQGLFKVKEYERRKERLPDRLDMSKLKRNYDPSRGDIPTD